MDKTFANNLRQTRPKANTDNTTVFEILTPNKFDKKCYVDLVNRQGLFNSYQDCTRIRGQGALSPALQTTAACSLRSLQMPCSRWGNFSVLTGNQGEIRANCSARNGKNDVGLWSVVEEGPLEGTLSQF